MKKITALLLSGLMICSAGSLASCDGKKPTDGTYHATTINRTFCRDVDGTIKISNSGNKVYFNQVYMDRTLISGDAKITNVQVYDEGICYWKADYSVERPVNVDGEEIGSYDKTGKCFANKSGKTLYIGSTIAAYEK